MNLQQQAKAAILAYGEHLYNRIMNLVYPTHQGLLPTASKYLHNEPCFDTALASLLIFTTENQLGTTLRQVTASRGDPMEPENYITVVLRRDKPAIAIVWTGPALAIVPSASYTYEATRAALAEQYPSHTIQNYSPVPIEGTHVVLYWSKEVAQCSALLGGRHTLYMRYVPVRCAASQEDALLVLAVMFPGAAIRLATQDDPGYEDHLR